MPSLRVKETPTIIDQWAAIKSKRVKPPALLKPIEREKNKNARAQRPPPESAPRRPSMVPRCAETFPPAKPQGLEQYPPGCPKHFDTLMSDRIRAGAASPLPRYPPNLATIVQTPFRCGPPRSDIVLGPQPEGRDRPEGETTPRTV